MCLDAIVNEEYEVPPRNPWKGLRHRVRESDPHPRNVRTREEQQLWLSAIRCTKCKCEYCVWGLYLNLLWHMRQAANAVRPPLTRRKRDQGEQHAEDCDADRTG